MPTVTHALRPSIGGNQEEARPTRVELKASTGMNMPQSAPAADDPLKTGQSAIKEETTPKEVTLPPQQSALARQQLKLQQEMQAFRDEKTEFESKASDYVQKSAFKAKFDANADQALKEYFGMNYEEITAAMLAQQDGADPVQALTKQVNQLKADRESDVSKQYDATLKAYKSETVSLTKSDPKAYFFINKEGQHDAVVQHIVATWEENPDEVLTVEQASKEIEEFLREEARAKKAALEELDGPPAPAEPAKKTLPPPQKPRTLTNQVDSSPQRTNGQFQHLSMKDRIAQAIARAQK